MNKDILLEEICSESFLMINRKMIMHLGLLKAALLSDLIQKRRYYRQNNQLLDGEWFFYRVKDIEKFLKISDFTQRVYMKEFENKGFINKKTQEGTTSRLYYYKINSEPILELLSKKEDDVNISQ